MVVVGLLPARFVVVDDDVPLVTDAVPDPLIVAAQRGSLLSGAVSGQLATVFLRRPVRSDVTSGPRERQASTVANQGTVFVRLR